VRRAILVIDVQRVYTDPASPLHCRDNAAVIGRINRVLAKAGARGDMVVQIRHLHRADGSDAGRMFDFSGAAQEIGFVQGSPEAEDDPALKLPRCTQVLSKQRYSCFVGTGLEAMLRAAGVGRIVVTGFITNFCCEATARHGHDLDFHVDFLLDATGCPDLSQTATQEVIKAIAAETLSAGYARVMTTEDWLMQV
jgi:nicotinamidase-related amidase